MDEGVCGRDCGRGSVVRESGRECGGEGVWGRKFGGGSVGEGVCGRECNQFCVHIFPSVPSSCTCCVLMYIFTC